MIKEKIISLILLLIFLLGLAFGILGQLDKKNDAEGLIRDIEESTQGQAKKTLRLSGQYEPELPREGLSLEVYKGLIERSPFFRVVSKDLSKKIVEIVKEVIVQEPKKSLFRYKGKVQMGTKQTIIIEDELTGKSYFLSLGDKVGGYEVFEIADDKVILKREGAEDIVLESKITP